RRYEPPGGTGREGNPSRSAGHADDEGHASEGALQASGKLHHTERDLLVFPQHDVMLEKNGIALAQVNFGNGNNLAFHLTGARAELDLGHVADTWSFAPSRFAHQIADIERRAA